MADLATIKFGSVSFDEALQALRDSPGSGWSLAGIALANSLLLVWLVHSTRQPCAQNHEHAPQQGEQPGAT